MSNQKTEAVSITGQTQVMIVLNQDQYKRLEGLVSNPIIGSNTTPLEVAHKLGVESVLKILRTGFVYGA